VIQHFLNPPNWFTAASIACSTYALALLVAQPHTPALMIQACVLVLFGGVFDLLDGRVARMTNRFSEFGVQLDSLADLVSFGVAPAMLAWAWRLHELGPLGAAVTFWYVIAAAFRLARFNVNSAHHSWNLAGHSQGLTTTMAGGCLVIFVWMSNGYLETVPVTALAAAGLVAALGGLMVSSLPMRSFKDMRQNPRARILFAVAFAASLTGALALDPSMWFGVGAMLYLSLGVVDGVITWAAHWRRGNNLDTVGTEAVHDVDEAAEDGYALIDPTR
jgi:CDP-diacylglycerol--serine O-phosphatidyltransferase